MQPVSHRYHPYARTQQPATMDTDLNLSLTPSEQMVIADVFSTHHLPTTVESLSVASINYDPGPCLWAINPRLKTDSVLIDPTNNPMMPNIFSQSLQPVLTPQTQSTSASLEPIVPFSLGVEPTAFDIEMGGGEASHHAGIQKQAPHITHSELLTQLGLTMLKQLDAQSIPQIKIVKENILKYSFLNVTDDEQGQHFDPVLEAKQAFNQQRMIDLRYYCFIASLFAQHYSDRQIKEFVEIKNEELTKLRTIYTNIGIKGILHIKNMALLLQADQHVLLELQHYAMTQPRLTQMMVIKFLQTKGYYIGSKYAGALHEKCITRNFPL